MSKQRPTTPDPSPGDKQRAATAPSPGAERKPKTKSNSASSWRLATRILVSVLASVHLLAVFVAPWALGLRGQEPFILPPRDATGRTIPDEQRANVQVEIDPPPLVEALYRVFLHYNMLLYTNSGYEYFTPDPVWNHLLDYEVFNAAGEKIASGRFPERRDQRPRLFYHRHMMLVDQTMNIPDSEYYIAEELLKKHGGERVRLQLIRHHLLKPAEVLAGKTQTDPSTYEVLSVLEQTRDELPPPRRELPQNEAAEIIGPPQERPR